MRHLLSIKDISYPDLMALVRRGRGFAASGVSERTLTGRVVGQYFRNPSTRTRISFATAALRLGASCISIGPFDLQTNTGESWTDTGAVLSCYLDAVVVRTAEDSSEQTLLAAQRRMAVINAMSRDEHPTQALADLITLSEHFGALEDLNVLYLGEGNNTAAALALAFSRIPGSKLTLLTPAGYGLDPSVLAQARAFATLSNASVTESHCPDALPAGVEVVYTTRWQTTGTAKADPEWRLAFRPFRVTRQLMQDTSGPLRPAVFLHDLPAVRGEEVDAAVLDGPQSLAFRQAENKMYAAMAVLDWCILDRPSGIVESDVPLRPVAEAERVALTSLV